jgi:hypothetical protein
VSFTKVWPPAVEMQRFLRHSLPRPNLSY